MRSLAVIALCLAIIPVAFAQPCSNADLRGAYLFQTQGYQNLNNLSPQAPVIMAPAAGLGVVEYDGAGSAKGSVTFTFGGLPMELEFLDLKYSVNRDCTGSAEYKLKDPKTGATFGPDKHRLLVLEDGAELRTLMVDAGGRQSMFTATLRRLGRAMPACRNEMIRGTYAMHYDAWFNWQYMDPKNPMGFAPAIGMGMVTFGVGATDTGGAMHNWGGMAMQTEYLGGNWAIKPDCTGTIGSRYRIVGNPQPMEAQVWAVVLDDGREIVTLSPSNIGFLYYRRVSIP
jgi:hypothetical protein